MKKFLLTGCILCVLTGFLLIMKSRPIGVVLFLVGGALGAALAAIMLKTGGYGGNDAFFHGLKGQGRQQSEVGKADTFQSGEQTAAIWDEMTKDKK